MKYVIGVDLGTSATKTILVDQNGKIVAEASVKYPMYQPENGWAEQDPSDWSEAAISTIKSVVEKGQVNGKDVRGIGISGQMHGLVMLNEENQVIRRSIIWCDQRATKQVEEMLELPMEKWMKITANPPMAGWTAAKILWIRENERSFLQSADTLCFQKIMSALFLLVSMRQMHQMPVECRC